MKEGYLGLILLLAVFLLGLAIGSRWTEDCQTRRPITDLQDPKYARQI